MCAAHPLGADSGAICTRGDDCDGIGHIFKATEPGDTHQDGGRDE